jgi:N6-adenosine-specific RNA methylase IME4
MNREAPNDIQPIVIGCYSLHATGLEVTGKPTLEEHEYVGVFILHAQRAVGWWVADWLRYGESRADWQERLSQVMDGAQIAEKTARNLKYIGENVAPSRRREDVDISLHSEVASLPPKEQEEWLEKAATEGWSKRELRAEIRASKRRRVIEGQATLQGRYRVIYADPPWLYSDSGPTEDDSLGKAERHYPGMTMAELCKLPIKAHSLPNSVLFMWVTTPMILLNPGPRDVLEAWGFDYKTLFTWDKILGMPGHYSNVVTEHLVLATRGDGQPDRPTPLPKSLFAERRTSLHSEKPTAIRKMIERQYIVGPYLELFARRRVPGWDCYGNDAGLWEIQKTGD